MKYLLSLLLFLSTHAAFAETISSSDQALVDRLLTQFNSALVENDVVTILELTPERLLVRTAEQYGVNSDGFLDMMRDAYANATGLPEAYDIYATSANLDITGATHPDGTPVRFGFLPYSFTIDAEGKSFTMESTMAIIHEKGLWSLVRVAQAEQLVLLKIVYPFLEGIEIPLETKSRI